MAAPTISNLNGTSANGLYSAGSSIQITIVFNQNVTVAGGTPKISLNTGAVVNYTSGSGTTILRFTYTVGAEESATLLDVIALHLNGSTIRNAGSEDAVLTLPNPALTANKSYKIVGPVTPLKSAFGTNTSNPSQTSQTQRMGTQDALPPVNTSNSLDRLGAVNQGSSADTLPGQGSIMYRDTDANGWKILAPSTAGLLLQTNGAGANPSYVSATGPQGNQGAPGAQGNQGTQGNQGVQSTWASQASQHAIGTSIANVGGLQINSLSANSIYEFEVAASVQSSSTAGLQWAVFFTGTVTSLQGQLWASQASGSVLVNRIVASATQGAAVNDIAGDGVLLIKGLLQSGGSGGNFGVQAKKVTSGTGAVYPLSYLKTTKIA